MILDDEDDGPARPPAGKPGKPRKRSSVPAEKRPEFVFDASVEQEVLRAMIASDAVRTWASLRLDDRSFFVKEHRPIFKALKAMADRRLAYDGVTLRKLLQGLGVTDDGSYLRELERTARVPDNIEWLVETMQWDSTRAEVLDGPLNELVEALQGASATPEEAAAKARSMTKRLEERTTRRFIRNGEEIRDHYLSDIRSRRVVSNFKPIGFGVMDRPAADVNDGKPLLTEGLALKRTSLVAGLSGAGKSTLMGEILIRQAAIGRRPLYCAWEMDPSSMLDVVCASITGIPVVNIVQGSLTDEQEAKVAKAVRWATERISFFENPFTHRRKRGGREYNDDRLDVLEGYLTESKCDLVIYDLWERMLCDLSYSGVTLALYRQQAIHKELNVHGMIVHQLTLKDVEKRADKRPTRDAIKGTGAFVEVADLIFGVHREGQFKSVPDDTVELICLKQRKGRANWATRYSWHPEIARIRGGEEVPFDPGLDTSELDGIGSIRSGRTKGKGKGKARGGRAGRPE